MPSINNRPYCKCGCGQLVDRKYYAHKKRNIIKGTYYKFIKGHVKIKDVRFDGVTDASGCSIDKRSGALRIYDKSHPKVKPGRMIPESHLIAEAALGKYLPNGVCVWHYDRDASNTINLVVCHNKKYMQLLRQRLVAYEKSGHANYRSCAYCHGYDDLKNMVPHCKKAGKVKSWKHQGCTRSRNRRGNGVSDG